MPNLENINLTSADVCSYYGSNGTYIPKQSQFYPANELPDHAFFHSGEYSILKSLILPSSITSIGPYALHYCSGITSITIPLGIKNIGQMAFSFCKGLTEITFSSSVESIGAYAFYGCNGLSSITLSSSVTTIGPYTFAYCSGLTSVWLNSPVTTIGSNAFCNCSKLAFVFISSSVTAIGDKAFSYCIELASIKIPKSVISLGLSIVYGCNNLDSIMVNDSNLYYSSRDGVLFNKSQSMLLSYPIARPGEYNIPSTVTSIEMNAFANSCNLTSISIPPSVTSIGAYAFASCCNLSSVTIPESISTITTQSFANCTSLTSIHIKNIVPPEVETDGLKNVSRTNCTIYVPKDMRKFYINRPTWSEFERIVEEDITTSKASTPEKIRSSIYTLNGMLVIENPDVDLPVAIYSSNGTFVKAFRTNGFTISIPLPSGIYIVKSGNQTTKVTL